MRVLDFFCGAGGFSEGFRQAGFEIIWAIDKWQPAVDTHAENHPGCVTVRMDIVALSLLPDVAFHSIVPDAEIIIGSPPCTFFSNSNRSGSGNKSQGKKLIEAFLRIVARKKFRKNSPLRYWILENVPNARVHIKRSYSAHSLGLSGAFDLKVKGVNAGEYNAKYYGVPSNRTRYFCGDFITPRSNITADVELIPLGTILDALGSPKERLHATIVDPLYGFTMPGEDVTDHHYVQELAEFEQITIRRLKQDKGYMGRMAVRENSDKPARTIMATMSFSSRECFVLGHGAASLRAPTIREVASLMSFPIDYRFYGGSLGVKYKLVGNAVPPKMSFAFASAINAHEQMHAPARYVHIVHPNNTYFKNLNLDEVPVKEERHKRQKTRFRYHIPEFKFDTYRVELTNYHSDFLNEQFKWDAEIHYNQGKNKARIFIPDPDGICVDSHDICEIDSFVESIRKNLVGFDQFQAVYCMTLGEQRLSVSVGPYELLSRIKGFISESFKSDFDNFAPLVDEPFCLPKPIALGYIALSRCLAVMTSKGSPDHHQLPFNSVHIDTLEMAI
ncbi:MAG TPA: DNA cytosine methyltransferase [Chryseolinea sp.]|nr:DNA cytosine methyltransferase [Chryseolinea sp.]